MTRRGILLVQHTLMVLIIILGLVSCNFSDKRSQDSTDEEELLIEYPIATISDFIETSPTDTNKLYPVNEEFLKQFLLFASQYEGQKLTVKTHFPQEWGVVVIERLPEGRELYLLQSENREWKYIAITSGMGTQRILDLIPVAVNIAVQNQDILETEIWKTTRNEMGEFSVEKTYTWVRSVAEESLAEYRNNPELFNRTTKVIDVYSINEMCRFDFLLSDLIPEYSAVIFYYQDGKKPEEWDEIVPILQSYCEDYEIIFDEIHQDFDKVMIRDYKLNNITTMDLTPFISETMAGLVLLKKDMEPKVVVFVSLERMRIEIKRYFKIIS